MGKTWVKLERGDNLFARGQGRGYNFTGMGIILDGVGECVGGRGVQTMLIHISSLTLGKRFLSRMQPSGPQAPESI